MPLRYNYGQNPYSVAQEFIWDNDLDQQHLDEIARWIDQQANQGVTLGAPVSGGFDPLTGANNVMHEAAAPAAAPAAAGGGNVISFGSDRHIPKKIMGPRPPPSAPLTHPPALRILKRAHPHRRQRSSRRLESPRRSRRSCSSLTARSRPPATRAP